MMVDEMEIKMVLWRLGVADVAPITWGGGVVLISFVNYLCKVGFNGCVLHACFVS